ncbi:GNAT family N-acetyltransferase [Pseudomonas sp. 8Z]|uniref:GNAT family N-acetyltransferase n=1 Tax=Pseudomonas sp. 8Z TaxID=2653166 RepID=UPI0012F3C2EE|nr:GNAT family N-acetyltransferase [Pseudomonas sp. 8Z]VXD05163.1 GNAT family N-acetyltransferase [Pseudomonas sp. 8Z]
MPIEIRPARASDAHAISRVIISALHVSNARDYAPEVIERVEQSFSVERVAQLIDTRQVLVAECNRQLLGTASLDGEVVRTVFIDPPMQGQGVGRLLMLAITRLAREQGIAELLVPSSLTARGFYQRLGFELQREVVDGAERTLVMARRLQADLPD